MLLERIDIDAHGPLHRVELGPLSESLNVVLAPEGAGKTAVARFLRDSLVDRDYPLGMLNGSTGRVVWADRHGLVHCRRERDGTSRGRRTIEFESRGEYPIRYDGLEQTWIRGSSQTTDASLALRTLQLPESVVDGVITDTSVTNVARVVAACLHADLETLASPAGRVVNGDGDRVASEPSDDRDVRERQRRLRADLAEVMAEIAQTPPADNSRVEALRRRETELLESLRTFEGGTHPTTPLAGEACRWLVRLSAGRLKRVEWDAQGSPVAPSRPMRGGESASDPDRYRRLDVRIDGCPEANCPAADRALAALAIRMAAGDRLARCGRAVPLVAETCRELWQTPHGVSHDGHPAFGGDPIAAAFFDYASAGRQLVVLTSSPEAWETLDKAGARRFRLFADDVIHPHRPLWKSEINRPSYAGPHPQSDAAAFGHASDPTDATRINRDFDVAWREAYGLGHTPVTPYREDESVFPPRDATNGGSPSRVIGTPSPATAAAVADRHRDGVYYGQRWTTRQASRQATAEPLAVDPAGVGPAAATLVGRQAAPGVWGEPAADDDAGEGMPFFLTVDSPIDHAPSVDAVIAARLRGLGITHVIHLMREDPNRLADTLGVANVHAATIRRWQAECRLVCRVPQLRGFDARILVGCGIVDPAKLAATPPQDLLHRVEAFLATERGQRILLSGTSYELCRITSWIASANRAGGRSASPPRDQTESGVITGAAETMTREEAASNRTPPTLPGEEARVGLVIHGGEGHGDEGHRRGPRDRHTGRFSHRRQAVPPNQTGGPAKRPQTIPLGQPICDGDSPIEELEGLGSRAADRLIEIGIQWVDDLLLADPETVARKLELPGWDVETVRHWQQTATLLCQVSGLRGFEARLLTRCGIAHAADLASVESRRLRKRLEEFGGTRQGSRILRGRECPSGERVAGWIRSAAAANRKARQAA